MRYRFYSTAMAMGLFGIGAWLFQVLFIGFTGSGFPSPGPASFFFWFLGGVFVVSGQLSGD